VDNRFCDDLLASNLNNLEVDYCLGTLLLNMYKKKEKLNDKNK